MRCERPPPRHASRRAWDECKRRDPLKSGPGRVRVQDGRRAGRRTGAVGRLDCRGVSFSSLCRRGLVRHASPNGRAAGRIPMRWGSNGRRYRPRGAGQERKSLPFDRAGRFLPRAERAQAAGDARRRHRAELPPPQPLCALSARRSRGLVEGDRGRCACGLRIGGARRPLPVCGDQAGHRLDRRFRFRSADRCVGALRQR
jgi:hypothetical protein